MQNFEICFLFPYLELFLFFIIGNFQICCLLVWVLMMKEHVLIMTDDFLCQMFHSIVTLGMSVILPVVLGQISGYS